jgi:hypothetical protein
MERKGLYCLIILEVSIHDQLALLLWAYDEAAHHSGEIMGSKDDQHIMADKNRRSGREWGPNIPFKSRP